ncbi:MAG TPA: hypothetical protein VK856_12310, partial [Anaerolineaceae bacterium]|nr:hypothetical protein [Anaerolineaceae bacterium]
KLSWLQNSWALLFLIPAIGSINNFYTELKQRQGFTFSLASNLMGILFPIAICIIFLLGLGWDASYPIIIILAGLSLFILGFVNDNKATGKIIKNLQFWFFSWGFAVVMIGIITVNNATDTGSAVYFWYGIALIIASLGGWVTGFLKFAQERKLTFTTAAHLLTAFVIAIPGLLAIFS